MDNTNDNIMVALIPTETAWCKQEDPHVTLIYVGKISETKAYWLNELVKATSSLSMITSPLYLKVSGIEVFGEEEKVDVLRLVSTPELLAIRSYLERWDTSDFSVYKPHATIGPVGSGFFWGGEFQTMPMFLYFNRIVVAWGDIRINFWLKTQ